MRCFAQFCTFLNCTNGTTSCKVSHIKVYNIIEAGHTMVWHKHAEYLDVYLDFRQDKITGWKPIQPYFWQLLSGKTKNRNYSSETTKQLTRACTSNIYWSLKADIGRGLFNEEAATWHAKMLLITMTKIFNIY